MRGHRSPQVGLGGEEPLQLLRTEAGAALVEQLLLRMEHGVYAWCGLPFFFDPRM